MKYLIKGDTYQVKEELKDLGCIWRPDKKAWVTLDLEEGEILYRRIEGLVIAIDAKMIRVELSKECQKIQDILDKGDLV